MKEAMAQSTRKATILEALNGKQLEHICHLALLLQEGPNIAEWSTSKASKRRYLNHVSEANLRRFKAFVLTGLSQSSWATCRSSSNAAPNRSQQSCRWSDGRIW